ncbi:K(lysine) acetyltransferase [Linderina macrospora]|uniref:K(Lysine) acetyltransferase n=1 Tax=Linderina macrospora TaxID=4868 RepID=A0ACC1JAE3_9FUNG|nr:K(lysine) acetyltransferase [Linderina macrospora]
MGKKANANAQPAAASDKSPRQITQIHLGSHRIAVWYASPYPSEYQQDLYICERCLKYTKTASALHTHACQGGYPRGRKIYEDGTAGVYEIDGKQELLYCQNLCLLSKLFLDQKTVYYDIGSFLFYVLLARTPRGLKFVGYFSKEKSSVDGNLLACILVLPPFRGQNFGQLLIEISYELARRDGMVGGPEQPLSPQGFHSFRAYWRRAVVNELLKDGDMQIVSLARLAERTGIRTEDILFTLDDLGLLEFWRGRHIVCVANETVRRVVSERWIRLAPRMDIEGMVGRSAGTSDCDDDTL